MYLNEDEDTIDGEKQLKVKIPVRMHVRLHTLKILTGETISDTVAEALEAYFRRRGGGPDPPNASEPAGETVDS